MNCALHYLKRAQKFGHVGALYAVGIILILGGEKQMGMQCLSAMKKDKTQVKEVEEGRKQLTKILTVIWTTNKSIARERPAKCPFVYQHMNKPFGWSEIIDDSYVECDICLSDNEIDCIYNSFRFI